jgi:glutamate-1-semialdehyde 2,1-aminomutase
MPKDRIYTRTEIQKRESTCPTGPAATFDGMKLFLLFSQRATSSRLFDVDGSEHIDYSVDMGPVILGHAHPVVDDAVARALCSRL